MADDVRHGQALRRTVRKDTAVIQGLGARLAAVCATLAIGTPGQAADALRHFVRELAAVDVDYLQLVANCAALRQPELLRGLQSAAQAGAAEEARLLASFAALASGNDAAVLQHPLPDDPEVAVLMLRLHWQLNKRLGAHDAAIAAITAEACTRMRRLGVNGVQDNPFQPDAVGGRFIHGHYGFVVYKPVLSGSPRQEELFCMRSGVRSGAHAFLEQHEPVLEAEFRNAVVFGQAGVIFNDDGFVSQVYSNREWAFDGDRITETMITDWLGEPQRLPGLTCLTRQQFGWWDNYFHFMTETAPQVQVFWAEHGASARYLLPVNTPFQAEVYRLLGVAEQCIVPLGPPVHAERLRASSPFQNKSSVHRPHIAALRRHLAGLFSPDEPDLLLFAGRRGAERNLLDEDHLAAGLASLGFRYVDTTGMAVAEQIHLFSRARMVVGCHGANLTNVMFMKKGIVLEIVPQYVPSTCYWTLAQAADLTYAAYYSDEGSSRGVRADFRIDINDVLAFVRRLLAM